ncbi:hypothetical protein IFR23_04570 [Sphingomonas sp. CFBP 13603]|uniref:hypothetical protein n=1 Tax=Sphingomonas sp. CFBP 13603 TaxID=2774040 RepID=UPI001867C234|nr:hypothetical protein [Sphingomonas sp. CFBP 13603]MBE2991285.1 hypothetical protein [Sphingomonas sp. CFBP 13603]
MNHTRQAFLEGVGGTGLVGAFPTAAAAEPEAIPDFGSNVIIVDPNMPAATVQARVDAILRDQERAHCGAVRQTLVRYP